MSVLVDFRNQILTFFIVYVKGKHISYQRSKSVTNPNVSLIQIEGVASPKDAKFYLGKRIAYVYRAPKEIRGSKIRVIWGKVTRTHGNNGLVRANFKRTCHQRLLVLLLELCCTHLTSKFVVYIYREV